MESTSVSHLIKALGHRPRVGACLGVQVSVTEQRPQNKDLPVLGGKHNCDRGSQQSQSGICRRSAHLPTLLMNPRTVSMGSLLEFLTFSSGFTLNYSLDCLFFFFCNKHAGWDHYHYYYFSICYFMISPFLAWSVPDWASPQP